MQKLKSNFIFLILNILILGCKLIPTYEIKTYPPNKHTQFHILNIDSRRISHECLFFNAKGDQNWRHHYYMHILNDKDEVITAQYPIDQEIDDCTDHLKKVEKIFKKHKTVKMCIRGEFVTTYANHNEIIDFKDLGKHSETYSLLDFDSICNSTECYSINETWIDTCPGFIKHLRQK